MLVRGRLYLQEIIDTIQTLLWLRVGIFSTTVQPVLLHHRHHRHYYQHCYLIRLLLRIVG